jgi:hypothetical protein
MSNSLLERQAGLLEYLTSGGAIFGEGDLSLAQFGLNRGLLHLEAKYSHQKRMEKIEAVLGRTLDLLGSERAPIVRAFAQACPPTSIGRLDNARQFHAFLRTRWREHAPEPPCLPDIAAFEIAYAGVEREHQARADRAAGPGTIRRQRTVALLRCAYDIAPLLKGPFPTRRGSPGLKTRRDTYLALAMPESAAAPVVYALSRELFAVVELLDEFTDPDEFADIPDADAIIAHFISTGLVEVSP